MDSEIPEPPAVIKTILHVTFNSIEWILETLKIVSVSEALYLSIPLNGFLKYSGDRHG